MPTVLITPLVLREKPGAHLEILARAAGRALEVDPGLEREIEAVSRGIATRLGRPYADFATGVTKQASLPAGARSLGLAGTAPGVLLELDGRVAIALPGPPPELRRLWEKAIEAPELVVFDAEGRPQTVKYHLLSSLLLAELQRMNARLEELERGSPLRTGERSPATVAGRGGG